MNTPTRSSGLLVTRYAGQDGGDGSLRVEYDRRRLSLIALASAFAAITTSAALVLTLAHMEHLPAAVLRAPGLDPEFVNLVSSVPTWAPIALTLAASLAVIRMLRNFYRLQDSDPAFVASPRDLRFKPGVFGESVRIPWTSIRGIRTRRHGKHRSIILQVDDLDRFVPRSGLLASLRPRRSEIALRIPLSRTALDELASLLQTYLARHGKAAMSTDAAGKSSAAAPPARSRAGVAAG